MDNDTPPKRITRARAAAKTKAELELKITTAAAKAKAPRAAASTSTKRKTRADDTVQETAHDNRKEDEMEAIVVEQKATRGRARKAVKPEAEVEPIVGEEVRAPVATKAARGRLKKAVEEAPVPELTRPTRGRPKKVDTTDEFCEPATVPVKKTTRARTAMSAKAATTESKKTVTFEEPEKENMVPSSTTKANGKNAQVATGLRAKPVRKSAITTRATRGQARTMPEVAEKSPLSPKKATQVAIAKESISEDELATMEKTAMKPLTKSPVKVPGRVFGASKKPDSSTSVVANRAILPAQDLISSLMASPARRPPSSPFRECLKTSPKRTKPGDLTSKSHFAFPMQPPKSTESLFKESLLQSPARRPPSPTKGSAAGSPSRITSTFATTPKASTFSITRFEATPCKLKTRVYDTSEPLFGPPATQFKNVGEEFQPNGSAITPFPGRLSAVLPRHADPALREPVEIPEVLIAETEASANTIRQDGLCADPISCDPMVVDEVREAGERVVRSTTPTQSPPRYSIGGFGSKAGAQDLVYGSDSEDELASTSPKYSPTRLSPFKIATKDFAVLSTPSPLAMIGKTPKTEFPRKLATNNITIPVKSQSVRVKKDKMTFAPLTRQFADWTVVNPPRLTPSGGKEQKTSTIGLTVQDKYNSMAGTAQPSPVKSSFFDDEMSIREETSQEQATDDEADAIDFVPTAVDEEDLALAAEADEMSLIPVDVEEAVESLSQSLSTRALSEASQEYGDENAIPIDPALLAFDAQPQPHSSLAMATPVRVLGEREFHTVSKVPLKPAGVESPSKTGMVFEMKNRSFSASRLPSQRAMLPPPAPLVPSPAKIRHDEQVMMYAPTPIKSNNWSTAVTPVRTPRHDPNNQILKGAIVYVDVHTTEGADASAVFVDLLGQMGAKCVKSWNWNPCSNSSSPETENESKGDDPVASRSGNKIGITHVVFKDGGKRTLEKVRETKGVVLCVGVGWVLDCERSNSWLSESPYTIDTSLVPRGGHRRRKSMEPRVLQNLNGSLSQAPSIPNPRSVSASHIISPTSEFLNFPDTPNATISRATVTQSLRTNRRKSTQWVRSPESLTNTNDELDPSSLGLLLSPVPPTPAPEAISAYAEHILDGEAGGETPYFPRSEELVQRTAPPKQRGATANEFGQLDLSLEMRGGEASVDDRNGTGSGLLMQRLLQARRKSLQWAPKVGSPLAKGESRFGV